MLQTRSFLTPQNADSTRTYANIGKMTSLIYNAWLPKQASCFRAGTMWAEEGRRGKKKKKKDKEELSEVKARAVACLVLGADT